MRIDLGPRQSSHSFFRFLFYSSLSAQGTLSTVKVQFREELAHVIPKLMSRDGSREGCARTKEASESLGEQNGELLGKSFDQPDVASGHNITEREIAAIRGWPRSFNLLGSLVQRTVFAIESDVK